jgi:hypothetical protein
MRYACERLTRYIGKKKIHKSTQPTNHASGVSRESGPMRRKTGDPA